MRLRLPVELEARVSMFLGGVFVAAAIAGVVLLAGPVVVSEVNQSVREVRVAGLSTEEKAEANKAARVTFADYLSSDPVVTHLQPVSLEYGVVIPKIGVNSKVLPQVNANDPQVYLPALQQGLAQAAGSVNPGDLGDNFIFGHSTDYVWNIQSWNALFYNLKDLEVGDKIYVFYQGRANVYQVSGKGIYEPQDVSFLNPNKNRERLVLQTCYPPGTTFKRLIVFAEPVGGQLEEI